MAEPNNNIVAGDWLCNFGEAQRNKQVTDRALALVAHQLGDITHIGKVMGFSQAKIHQYQSNNPFSVSSQISRMFFDWRAKLASAATVEKFVELMKEAEVGETMVMEVIMREYSGGVVNGVMYLR